MANSKIPHQQQYSIEDDWFEWFKGRLTKYSRLLIALLLLTILLMCIILYPDLLVDMCICCFLSSFGIEGNVSTIGMRGTNTRGLTLRGGGMRALGRAARLRAGGGAPRSRGPR